MGILSALGKLTGLGGGTLSGGAGFSSGKSTTQSSGTSNTQSTAEQTGTSSTSGQGTTSIVTTSLDENSKRLLDALTQQLSGQVAAGVQGYSKADAITDVAGTVQAIFKQYKEQDVPQIFAAMGQAGAYNSTNAQLIANDALAEAIGKASTATFGAIKDYAGISQAKEGQFMDSLLKAFQVQSEATKTQQQQEAATSTSTSKINESSDSTTNYNSTDTTKSSSKSLNLGFKL